MPDLNKKAAEIRKLILKSSFEAKACHIGSALSCVEILVELYYKTLKKEDIFLFSKASGVAALYAILADKGYFPKEKLAYYLKNYPLPDKNVPGILHSCGSLGHGLNVAAGLALAKKLNKEKGKVYCLISDAELQEGSTYEALLFSYHHHLPLIAICDFNKLQACGKIKDILDIPKFIFKFPDLKIIKTIKGQGISFLENKVASHYLNLTLQLYEKALLELN